MPKMKSLKSATKRFKVTGSGKIRYKKNGMRHLLSKQRAQKKRALKRASYLEGGQDRTVREMILA